MVVAVSGGPDSVALLHALVSLHIKPLIIAHLNHRLRGAEADDDEAFVRELGLSLKQQGPTNLVTCIHRVDVAARAAESGENLEAVGREERYRWFTEVARQYDVAFVATGHTADDQAETVLHRLLRGTGVQGLRGIAVRRRLTDEVEVVRPLLTVNRAEVLGYLGELGVLARQDSSNADLKYTRNRIRHRLLPLLEEQFNPAIRSVLARLAEEANEVFAEEQEQARHLLSNAERPRTECLLVFSLEALRGSSRRRVRQLFRLVWEREEWDVGQMSREHWNRLQAMVFDELTAVDLPGRIRARRRDSVLQIGRH